MAESVLITGTNRGIGHALAVEFQRAGFEVFAGARNPDVPVLSALAEEFPNFHPLQLDVVDDASVARAAAEVGGDSLDILVNNAAIFPGEGNESLEELDLDWFEEAIAVNVAGTARVTRAFLPALRKSGKPRVANISSGAGSISRKTDHFYYPYSVSKAGLNMLTRAMASEFKGSGIVVAAICPGWVKTEMGGPNAQITAEESAKTLITTICNLQAADSGCFLGRDGNRTAYQW